MQSAGTSSAESSFPSPVGRADAGSESSPAIRADSSLGLIPPKRLGGLLAATRERQGLSLPQVAVASGGRFSVGDLRRIEAGRSLLDDDAVVLLAASLGLPLENVVPQRARLIIDSDEGWMESGTMGTPFAGGIEEWQVLLRYLTLVYAMRNLRAGQRIVPRVDDLEVLGQFLGRRPAAVRRTLEQIMAGYRKELKASGISVGRRVAIPALGVLVAVIALGGSPVPGLVAGPGRAAVHESMRPGAEDVEIGAALVLVREQAEYDVTESDVAESLESDAVESEIS